MEQSSKQMCIVLRIVSILSPTNNFAIQQGNVCKPMCPLMLCINSHKEAHNNSQVSVFLNNYCLTVVFRFVCVLGNPTGYESMRLCIGSPHSWCTLVTNIWILVPRVPLLIRGWWGAMGSRGDSSPVSMNLPVSHHRAQCCRLQFVRTYLASQHINNSGFNVKHEEIVLKFILWL